MVSHYLPKFTKHEMQCSRMKLLLFFSPFYLPETTHVISLFNRRTKLLKFVPDAIIIFMNV